MSKDVLGVSVHEARGVVADLLEKLGGAQGHEWLEASKRFLRKEEPWSERLLESYLVTVDYSKSLADMIAAGRYNSKNPDITDKNFPHDRTRGTETVAIELAHFDRYMTSGDVLRELDQRGLRAATLPEGLALAVLDPDLQRKFPVVLLASVRPGRDGGRFVPYLGGYVGGRFLSLSWFEGGWDAIDRFAAVCK